MFKNQTSPEKICLGVAWITDNEGGTQIMLLIFLSGHTLLIKIICVGSASTNKYLYSIFSGCWSIGDTHRQISSGISGCSTKSGYPPRLVDHDIWNFEHIIPMNSWINLLLMVHGSWLKGARSRREGGGRRLNLKGDGQKAETWQSSNQ